jgi:hypothetical protein
MECVRTRVEGMLYKPSRRPKNQKVFAMINLAPYAISEFALSNVDSLSSWEFFAERTVEVPIGHFNHPKKLKNAHVHFIPSSDDAILQAVVQEILKDNMARVSVKVPYSLRHVSLQHGEISHPFHNKIHPRLSLIAKFRLKWHRLIHRSPRSPPPVVRPVEDPRFDNDYGKEEITFLQAIQ